MVKLIPFKKEHIEKTFTWVSNPALQRLFLIRGQPTWNSHIAYFSRVLCDHSNCVFAIIYKNMHCGNCGFKNIISGQEGELWIYIGDTSLQGIGIGKVALEILIDKGFKEQNFKVIYVHLGDFNVVARDLYEFFGFKQVPLKESNKVQWENRQCEIIRMELKR